MNEPLIASIAKLSLGPTDILVIRDVSAPLSQRTAAIQDHLSSILPHKNKVIFLAPGVDIGVLSGTLFGAAEIDVDPELQTQ